MLPQPHRIRRVRRETKDTFTVALAPEGTGPVRPFAPGQFNMVYIFGVGEIPLSISGDPARTQEVLHTTRVVGTVTQAMSRLRAGSVVGVRGPFGSAWPVEAASDLDVVVVAGGIGLAPLRPALHQLVARRKQLGQLLLLYGARTPGDILYDDQLKRWNQDGRCQVHITVDRSDETWAGDVGVVTTLIPRAPFDPERTLAMLCGPEVMMRFTLQELLRRGVAPERIYLSIERNMKCAVGWCGHCQYGPEFVCKDGPVFRYDRVRPWFHITEF